MIGSPCTLLSKTATVSSKSRKASNSSIDYRQTPAGDLVKFDRVLAYRDESGLKIGRPTVESATVTAKVVSVVQGPKLVIQKARRRRTSAAAPAIAKSLPGW